MAAPVLDSTRRDVQRGRRITSGARVGLAGQDRCQANPRIYFLSGGCCSGKTASRCRTMRGYALRQRWQKARPCCLVLGWGRRPDRWPGRRPWPRHSRASVPSPGYCHLVHPEALVQRSRIDYKSAQKLSFISARKCWKCSVIGVTFAMSVSLPSRMASSCQGEANLHPLAF